MTQSMIALMNLMHLWELRGNVGGVVSGAVIDKNDFVGRII